MRWLAVILLTASAAIAQEPEAQPAVVLTVQTLDVIRLERIELAIRNLTEAQKVQLAHALNRSALFEARTLSRLTKHRTGPENYLYYQIKAIRETAKTDPVKAEQMIAVIVEQFKKWGVDL
jgi:hypothetical protein